MKEYRTPFLKREVGFLGVIYETRRKVLQVVFMIYCERHYLESRQDEA